VNPLGNAAMEMSGIKINPKYLSLKNVTWWLVWSAGNFTSRTRLWLIDRSAVDVCTYAVSKVGINKQKQNTEAD
jgi:hypothetical protein